MNVKWKCSKIKRREEKVKEKKNCFSVFFFFFLVLYFEFAVKLLECEKN